MFGGLKSSLLRTVGYASQLAYDFLPAKTMEEVSHIFADIRRGIFDEPNAESIRRVESALSAARASKVALVQANANEAAINAVSVRARVLQDLVQPVPIERDVLAGSLAEEIGEPPQGWERVGDHPSTLNYALGRARRLMGRFFEDREIRDAAVTLRTQIHVRRRLLSEMYSKVELKHKSEVEAQLSALHIAEAAASRQLVSEVPVQARQSREEIPIE